MKKEADEIKKSVKEHYANLAQQTANTCCSSQSRCCQSGEVYTAEELQGLPESVLTLGCGNPTGIAELKPGEVVLDLGSGGGIDCFLAAKKVGAEGKVIGLDMTSEMIELARENAAEMGVTNVEFRLGEMENMPVQAESVDVIISNCVINLSPDKDKVFKEAYRILKPGGRISISDIVTFGELPQQIRDSMDAWARCVAGALDKDVYLAKIKAAGFKIEKVEKHSTNNRSASKDLTGRLASIGVLAVKPLF